MEARADVRECSSSLAGSHVYLLKPHVYMCVQVCLACITLKDGVTGQDVYPSNALTNVSACS